MKKAVPVISAGLLGAFLTTAAIAQDLKEITVLLPNPSALNVFPMYVAIGEGYFEAEGLKVNVEAVNGSAMVLQAMAAGQAQIGNPGAGPFLNARARGEDVVFIYNNFAKSGFGLVVRDESTVQSPAELKGMTVGVGTADGAEVGFARAILTDAGLTEGTDYEFLAVGDGGPAAAAFERGDIDAHTSAVVDVAIMGMAGLKLREITPPQFLGYFGNGFAANRDYIEANPDVIEGFGRAYVKGIKFSLDDANTPTVLAHAAAGNPQEGEDTAFASAFYETVRERITPTDLSKGWGYNFPEHWEMWQASLVEGGDLEAPLDDLAASYTNDFVPAWNED